MNKHEYDWQRAYHNLPPRPMDWQEKLVVTASVIAIVIFALMLLEGIVK